MSEENCINKVGQSSVRINLRFCMIVYRIGIIYIYYHAKSGCYSFKIGGVMANFEAITFLLLKFVRNIHRNFHAKSGVCSSKNE